MNLHIALKSFLHNTMEVFMCPGPKITVQTSLLKCTSINFLFAARIFLWHEMFSFLHFSKKRHMCSAVFPECDLHCRDFTFCLLYKAWKSSKQHKCPAGIRYKIAKPSDKEDFEAHHLSCFPGQINVAPQKDEVPGSWSHTMATENSVLEEFDSIWRSERNTNFTVPRETASGLGHGRRQLKATSPGFVSHSQ